MVQHLGMDQVHKRLLVILQHIHHVIFFAQVGSQMRDDLASQLVEQCRVIVITDIIEINQPAHQVIFRPFLLDHA